MSITVTEGRIFVDGKETTDPTLIGYAIIDAAEANNLIITTSERFEDAVTEVIKTSFDAGIKAIQIAESVGKRLNIGHNDN